MIKDYFIEQLLLNFGHAPTEDQREAASLLTDFILSGQDDELFLLCGFAGTGKTSLVAALVKTMEQVERQCVLMAPTGRAAKVFSLYANHPAYTIHKRIYRQKSIDQDSIFSLNYNMLRQTLFVVDEASMISDTPDSMSLRSSLLDDLISFVYAGQTGCRLILVGDTAQLPPVGEADSPALRSQTLHSYGMTVRQAWLRQIVRQTESSGILWNATRLRSFIDQGNMSHLPQILFQSFADVKNVPGDELIETLSDCYHRHGIDDTMVVCRSNKRAIVYNNGIRSQILGNDDELCSGDQLMIAKNNYFWLQADYNSTEKGELSKHTDGTHPHLEEPEGASLDFLANGDIAVVERVRNMRELYGFHFADCELRLPDYDDHEVEATVLLDALHAEAPALTHEQQESLFNKVLEDYADIPQKHERMKRLRQDPYFNSLQVKYAYAVTCHKAQGGQWGHIFIDQGYMTDDMLGPDYFRWLYTAITRATTTVYFVNWREEQTLNVKKN